MKNNVWEIVQILEEKSKLNSNWIYKIKHAINDNINKYKVRFVSRGFSQKEGADYIEAFSPLAMYTSISTIVYLDFVMGARLHQMDVNIPFLNGVMEEEVHIKQP